MKISGNFEDKNRIRRWHEAGKSASQISEYVQIEVDYVVAYLKTLEPAAPELSPQQKGALTKKIKREQEEAEAQAPTTEA